MAELDPVRVHYVEGFIRLSLWYVNKRLRETNDDVAEVVNTRVNFYRNTSLYDGKRHPASGDEDLEWNGVIAKLGKIFDQYSDDTRTVEEEGFAVLWPFIEPTCVKTKSESSRSDGRPYECWTYDYHAKTRVAIHIGNVYQPKSPLSDMLVQFAASLIRLLKDSQVRRPDVKEVQCGSWMNSTPRFQMLFPKAWQDSAEPRPDIRYTMGSWGQFMDRTGRFHERNGALFRETGELPYASTQCYCTIEEALNHLESAFPEAVAHNNAIGYTT